MAGHALCRTGPRRRQRLSGQAGAGGAAVQPPAAGAGAGCRTRRVDLAWIDKSDAEAAIAASNGLAFRLDRHRRHLAILAGRHLKKSVLELGGSNPVIVLKDADVELAAREAATSRFRDAGQSCNAAKRMILVPEIADAFIEAFMHEVAAGAPATRATRPPSWPRCRADLRQTLRAGGGCRGTRRPPAVRGPAARRRRFLLPGRVLENVPPASPRGNPT